MSLHFSNEQLRSWTDITHKSKQHFKAVHYIYLLPFTLKSYLTTSWATLCTLNLVSTHQLSSSRWTTNFTGKSRRFIVEKWSYCQYFLIFLEKEFYHIRPEKFNFIWKSRMFRLKWDKIKLFDEHAIPFSVWTWLVSHFGGSGKPEVSCGKLLLWHDNRTSSEQNDETLWRGPIRIGHQESAWPISEGHAWWRAKYQPARVFLVNNFV